MKYQELQDEVKAALKAHDKPRVSILRQVHGEVKNIEVNERREITDADVDAMLKRVIKQTKETLEGSIKAGNNQERPTFSPRRWKFSNRIFPSRFRATSLSRSSRRRSPRPVPPRRRRWGR